MTEAVEDNANSLEGYRRRLIEILMEMSWDFTLASEEAYRASIRKDRVTDAATDAVEINLEENTKQVAARIKNCHWRRAVIFGGYAKKVVNIMSELIVNSDFENMAEKRQIILYTRRVLDDYVEAKRL